MVSNYLGISRLSCAHCHKLLHDKEFGHRGTHGICNGMLAGIMEDTGASYEERKWYQHRQLSTDHLYESDQLWWKKLPQIYDIIESFLHMTIDYKIKGDLAVHFLARVNPLNDHEVLSIEVMGNTPVDLASCQVADTVPDVYID